MPLETAPAIPDAVAFGEALERHRAAICAVALDRIGRLDVAEEIGQQAIALAWEHRAQLRDSQALPSWLFRIAVNCCWQWERREGRWGAEAPPEKVTAENTVVDEVLRRETLREVRSALWEVPVKNRIAFLMHVYGYSYDQIAAFLEVPSSTVRGRLARTREWLRRSLISRLRESLGQEGDDPG